MLTHHPLPVAEFGAASPSITSWLISEDRMGVEGQNLPTVHALSESPCACESDWQTEELFTDKMVD